MKRFYKNMTYIIIFFMVLIIFTVTYNIYTAPVAKHKVFGVSYMTMNNPFYKIINNEILKVVEKNNDTLITLDPELDVDKQNEQIYKFIDQKVDGIFINPIDFEQIEPALQAAKRANIPVIIIDAPVSDESLVNCTIVSDNYDAGVQCAKDMMERLDSANIVLLKHTTAKSAKERIEGFLSVIDNNEKYKVINEAECDGQLEIAMPKMQEIIKQTPDIDVVMALNDPSALGALAALEKNNKNDVMVYGIDGTPEIKALIGRNQMIVGTVAQSPIKMGQIAVENMYNILNGKKVEKNIIIPISLINKENLFKYDEDRWQ
ncbi:sugar ABC transporter substrate-binding protein [Megamonas funiformis]|uniref:sugar ABC transporter substrate-binding protein n=2 Tax=Megamonas funiformis TaxID=437897 RepID=UPI001430CAF1|nr:sugar ABC transporter substrate-binding protein [Megamonas funiformis]MCX4130476.1 sugar ABC transporter substrate-binding protein [Megamonas funiformis]NJE28687.1 sugar ABC transporter substrate-binding protein [Megamonas funiformis]